MDAKTAFSQHAGDYDRTRRQLVPDFDNFYGIALELIPYAPTADLRVLDLGAGTGLFSSMIGAAYPNAHLTLADFSPQMLDQARQRFVGRAGVEYLLLDYEHEFDPRRLRRGDLGAGAASHAAVRASVGVCQGVWCAGERRAVHQCRSNVGDERR